MSDPAALFNDLSEEAVWRLDAVCCRFEESWQAGQRPGLEDFLADAAGVERLAVLRELLRLDTYYRRRAGEQPAVQDYATRFPDATDLLGEILKKRPGNPQVLRQMAGVKLKMGELCLQMDRIPEARALSTQVVELYEGLLRKAPCSC